MTWLGFVLLLAGCSEPDPSRDSRPLGNPALERARAQFQLPEGFEISLVAAEPDVVDPVALAFDEQGRLYVVEMPGFPNGDTALGVPSVPGRIRRLEHPDADHRYRSSTTFVSGLAFPTSVMPYRKGILVACAPEILYFEDPGGEGRATLRRVLYRGFGQKNIEAQVNGLQWGLDNQVHGLGSFNGGEIVSPDRPEKPAVPLEGRGFRFRPDAPGSLEPTLARGQFGLAADDLDRWFTCTNNEHLKHVVLDDRYLAREPYLAAPPAVVNIPDHGSAAKLYRVSPFEAWRVERTARRANSDQRSRFPAAELVPGGYVTSACGLVAYGGGLFPPDYDGNLFVCDPANNVVHRDVLVPEGASFVARRASGEAEREFLASTDPSFRPVNLAIGPDGALYVADFHRDVIEGASFIPEDIKKRLHLNFESGGQGRIWRVAPKGRSLPAPDLARASARELVGALSHSNAWCRRTAQRLLVQDQRREAAAELRTLLAQGTDPRGRLHALWTLEGLGELSEAALLGALADRDPGVREHAVGLAETHLGSATPLETLALDPSPRVRFQLALSLGRFPGRAPLLARLAARDGGDPYLRAALLSSAGSELLELARGALEGGTSAAFLSDLSGLVGARRDPAEILAFLVRIEKADKEPLRETALRGLAQGIRQRRKGPVDLAQARETLGRLLGASSPSLRAAAADAAGQIRTLSAREREAEIDRARAVALDETRALPDRARALETLGSGDSKSVSGLLVEFLGPRQPESLQKAAAEALGALTDPAVADLILAQWRRLTPGVRERMIDLFFERKERLGPLLDAIARGDLSASDLDARRRAQLRGLPDPQIARRAETLLKEAAFDPKLFEEARGALGLGGDAARGHLTFRKLCITCHQAAGEGASVGPALASVRDNPPEEILKNILYPSLAIAPQYAAYLIETTDGQLLNGLIVESSEAALTLRRPSAEDQKILRRDIKNLVASRVSLMPENLLKGLSLQDIADLIRFVQEIH